MNNARLLFRRYQKDLLWMANSDAGRYLLGVKDKDKIVKITPNSFHQLRDFVNDKPIIQAPFYVGNPLADVFLPLLEKMKIADEYSHIDDPHDALLYYANLKRSRLYPQLYLATQTFDTLATEGLLSMNGEYTYSFARSSSTADQVEASPPFGDGGRQLGAFRYGGGTFNDCCRAFFAIQTSALGVGAMVTDTLFRWTRDTRSDTSTPDGIVCPSTQADPTSLVAADYSRFSYTAWSDVVSPSSPSTLYTWTFNTDGKAGVNVSGYTKFVLINYTYDFNNGTPTAGDKWAEFYTHISGSGSTLPNIYVTYTPGFSGMKPININQAVKRASHY